MGNVLLFAPVMLLATGPDAPPAPTRNPTLSLEVTGVNSVPLRNGPTSEISAVPGQVLTASVFCRDWSPDGEKLRGYQAMVDHNSFISGRVGTIRPVAFDETSAKMIQNKENAFIDERHPRYLFPGLKTIAIVDRISPSYRFMGVVQDGDDAILSPQDGTKYYCGTVRLQVSDDAHGTFTIRLNEAGWASVLNAPESKKIIPLDFEHLTVHVLAEAPRIVSTEPPNGAIDARWPARAGGEAAGGWKQIRFTFGGDAAKLTAADFRVEDGSSDPPRIERLLSEGQIVTIVLSRLISAGTWTSITHIPSNAGIRVAALPGDVNSDGVLDPSDIGALVDEPGTAGALPGYRADVDRDGKSGVGDALRVIDLLNDPDVYRIRLNK